MSPLSLLVLACTGEDKPQGSVPAPAPTVSMPEDVPWVMEVEESPAPIELASVEATIQDAIVRMATFDPSPVLDAYRALALGADETCPARYVSDDVDYWLDECTSGAGTAFVGFGLDDLTMDSADGVTVTVSTVGGVGRVESADGQWMNLNGFVQLIEAQDAFSYSSTLAITGEFETNHEASASTWLEQGLRPNLVVSSYVVPGLGNALVADGTLQGLGGELPVVAFENATLIDEGLGISDCSLEPAGTASAQLPDGSWVDVIFDPVIAIDRVVTEDPSTCDGCGRVWQGPVEIGTACFDFSSWL